MLPNDPPNTGTGREQWDWPHLLIGHMHHNGRQIYSLVILYRQKITKYKVVATAYCSYPKVLQYFQVCNYIYLSAVNGTS